MGIEDHEKIASDRLNQLMEEINDRAVCEMAAMNVVRMLVTYLQDGGEIPMDLVLSIGGCLEDYVDIDGKCSDPDIQQLHEEVVKIAGF